MLCVGSRYGISISKKKSYRLCRKNIMGIDWREAPIWEWYIKAVSK